MSQHPFKPPYTACYKCGVRVLNTTAPICDKCWDDNLKIAAAGWKGAEKLTLATEPREVIK